MVLPGIRRVKEKYSSIGVVYSGINQEEIAYCQRCLEMASIRSKLGNRIYLPDESGKIVTPPDADKWRQFHKCGTVYPKYEAKQEAELTSLTDPSDNPFKFGNAQIHAVGEVRKFDRTCKTQHKKQFKRDLSEDLRNKRSFSTDHMSVGRYLDFSFRLSTDIPLMQDGFGRFEGYISGKCNHLKNRNRVIKYVLYVPNHLW